MLRDSTTGKFMIYSTGSSDSGAASIAAWKMANPTTLQAILYNYNNAMTTGGLLPKYIRLKNNGTFRTVAVSEYGHVWFTISIVPAGDHMNENEFGYALRGTGDSMAAC